MSKAGRSKGERSASTPSDPCDVPWHALGIACGVFAALLLAEIFGWTREKTGDLGSVGTFILAAALAAAAYGCWRLHHRCRDARRVARLPHAILALLAFVTGCLALLYSLSGLGVVADIGSDFRRGLHLPLAMFFTWATVRLSSSVAGRLNVQRAERGLPLALGVDQFRPGPHAHLWLSAIAFMVAASVAVADFTLTINWILEDWLSLLGDAIPEWLIPIGGLVYAAVGGLGGVRCFMWHVPARCSLCAGRSYKMSGMLNSDYECSACGGVTTMRKVGADELPRAVARPREGILGQRMRGTLRPALLLALGMTSIVIGVRIEEADDLLLVVLGSVLSTLGFVWWSAGLRVPAAKPDSQGQ